jgi:demethylmenaquinone methyltransferase / 2-methoxy-6-polyprenyl-1,4-benzoquinol methylase
MRVQSANRRASLSKRRAAVSEMFDGVAPRYDLVNRLLTLGLDRLWRSETVAAVAPAPGQVILDLAAGTGTSTHPFAASGATVIPADISEGMLAVGKLRQPDLDFVNADALALPFADETFDAVTISFGLRNVENVPAALSEMYRVTKPGGRIVICEFSTPTWKPFRHAYRRYLVRAFPLVVPFTSTNPAAYDYLIESILAWPDQQALAAELTKAGWQRAGWKNLSGGIVALHRAHR